jgi:RNA polymerase sigma factor (sigma-70 family)
MRSSPDQLNPGRPTGAWLLQQHRLFIARYARQLGRGAAEDLASEAIVRSLRHPAPDGHHGPWLERVFRNLLVDHLRRRARGQRADAVAEMTMAPNNSPEQRAAEAQLRRRLAALWPELRPEWQQALAASFGEDRAAAVADLSPITVRTRTFRALGMLRRALGVMRGWVPLPTSFSSSLSLSAQLQPLAAALIPSALAVTTAVAPAAPEPPRLSAPRVIVQRVERKPAAPPPATPAPPAPVSTARPRPPVRPPAPAPAPEPPKAVQHFQFGDDDITGDLQRPDGDQVTGAPARAPHGSLIEIRGSFIAAMVRTLEDL